MILLEPTMEYADAIQAFRQEFLSSGDSMDGCGSLRRMENIQDWIDQVESLKSPETTPSHWVPCTQYIYLREEDTKVVGVIQIRHYFNEFLEKYAGHIGYSVCKSERRKGYATQMLAQVLHDCKDLGINPVMVCCLDDNEGSRKTILHNGGVYESTVHEPKENVNLERYWISIGEMPEPQLQPASAIEAELLTDLSVRAFHSDYPDFGDAHDGPPDYDNAAWHLEMQKTGHLYSFKCGERTIGGAVLFRKGTLLNIGRIFIDPTLYRKGYGSKLMQAIESLYPDVQSFTLDTPVNNRRTNAFYHRQSYTAGNKTSDTVEYHKSRESGKP